MICWTDSLEVAISLSDKFPDIDPKTINFVDLREMVINLDDFEEGMLWQEEIKTTLMGHDKIYDAGDGVSFWLKINWGSE